MTWSVESASDLQRMLDALKTYCDINKLEVNVNKTKVMIFHRGRLPEAASDITYDGKVLEVVNNFCYLGFWLTVQLSFTRHLEATIAKARSRAGLLFAKLPLVHIPLNLTIEVFEVFLAPLFHYGLALWSSNVSNSALQALDAVWTKYLKRYLCLPASANNAMVYFVTNTEPLSKSLLRRAPNQIGGLIFPESFSGLKMSFLENTQCDMERYDPVPLIPSTFWITRQIETMPTNMYYRKMIMRDIFDIDHLSICSNNNFHTRAEESCVCRICSNHAHPYHLKYCSL